MSSDDLPPADRPTLDYESLSDAGVRRWRLRGRRATVVTGFVGASIGILCFSWIVGAVIMQMMNRTPWIHPLEGTAICGLLPIASVGLVISSLGVKRRSSWLGLALNGLSILGWGVLLLHAVSRNQ